VADGRGAAVSWDGAKGRNIKWKAPIPGLAHSSPVVWENRVFVTTAAPLQNAAAFQTKSDSNDPVPTPFVAHDQVFVTGGWPGGRAIKVFRTGGSGDLSLPAGQNSSAQVAWRSERGGPYVPTPIVYGDYLYVYNDKGALSCHNVRTGELIFQHRINEQGAGFSASPVAADGKLYFPSEDGEIYVLKAGPKYELLSVNPMGEALMATPAISDGVMFVRGRNHLFAVEQKVPAQTAKH
jgi:outer membrane protein assembly factor BamB